MVRRVVWVVAVATALYFAIAAYCLRFELGRLLFPATPALAGETAAETGSYTAKSGGELLVRRFGKASVGCIVFFPGQHGASAGYDFSPYIAAGFEVFALAYPGQDGASGSTKLGEIQQLVDQAVLSARGSCPSGKTVLVGVSLGSMLAAYSARTTAPAGVVLIAAAPSLSSALRIRIKARWYLAPLSLLPVSKLLAHDFSLEEALEDQASSQVVIFQGTADTQTPLDTLRSAVAPLGRVKIVSVPGATHSTTFEQSQVAHIAEVLRMLEQAGSGTG